MWSKSGNLKLDTGDLVFDNYRDKDISLAVSGGLSLNLNPGTNHPWDVNLPAQYKNLTALIFATIGAGDINIRNRAKIDLASLNRDPANLKRSPFGEMGGGLPLSTFPGGNQA